MFLKLEKLDEVLKLIEPYRFGRSDNKIKIKYISPLIDMRTNMIGSIIFHCVGFSKTIYGGRDQDNDNRDEDMMDLIKEWLSE